MAGMERFHGLFSIGMLSLALIIGLTAMFVESLWLGILYGVVMIAGLLGALNAYCAKCPARTTGCGHVVIGPLTEIFPARKQGPYTKGEYGIVAVSLLALILLPQYWLIRHVGLFITFWVLTAAALVEINCFVCTRCENTMCIACRKQNRPKK